MKALGGARRARRQSPLPKGPSPSKDRHVRPKVPFLRSTVRASPIFADGRE
jgi:hypothetical protein